MNLTEANFLSSCAGTNNENSAQRHKDFFFFYVVEKLWLLLVLSFTLMMAEKGDLIIRF